MTPEPASSYRARVREKIRLATDDDVEEIVAFRRRMYGPASFLASRDYLSWMFDHPGGLSCAPSPQWLFRAEGTVEGQQAGIRTAMSVEGRDIESLWATDFFVDPAYQLRGVGAVLSEVTTDAAPLTMGVEVSDAARRSFLRAGWSDFGIIPTYVRPIDVAAVARDRDVPLPGVVTAALDLAGRAITATAHGAAKAAGIRLQEVERFDERADEIWRDCRRHYAVVGRRDASTLNWRYVAFPRRGYYRCFYLWHGDDPVGYAVLGSKDGAIEAGRIVDYLCPPKYAALLLSGCVRALQRSGADLVYCMQQSPRHRRAFAAAGFLRRSSGFPLMMIAKRVDARTRAIVSDPSNWYVTYGDSNIDHPREGTVFAS